MKRRHIWNIRTCARKHVNPSSGAIGPHSHQLLPHKDENFVQRLHVPDEVKHVGLFLLFANDQDLLHHRVNCLQTRKKQKS